MHVAQCTSEARVPVGIPATMRWKREARMVPHAEVDDSAGTRAAMSARVALVGTGYRHTGEVRATVHDGVSRVRCVVRESVWSRAVETVYLLRADQAWRCGCRRSEWLDGQFRRSWCVADDHGTRTRRSSVRQFAMPTQRRRRMRRITRLRSPSSPARSMARRPTHGVVPLRDRPPSFAQPSLFGTAEQLAGDGGVLQDV